MVTETEQPQSGIPPEVDALMRLLANLNAGAMLALCLWLAFAASDYNARRGGGDGAIQVQGCGCTLSEITNWNGRLDMAAAGE